MFEWTQDLGTRPVEGTNGSLNGRETRYEACSCGAGNSVYTDTGELCDEQSAALHAEYHGYESVEALNQAMEESAGDVAESFFDAVIAPMLLESMLGRALGLPPGVGIRVIPISAEEAVAMGFTMPSDENSAPEEGTDDDWLRNVFGENPPPAQ